jgi:hypothetical protein
MLHLKHSLVRCSNFGHSGKPIKIPLQFRTVVLEKDGDQLDPSCEKQKVLYSGREERNVLHTMKRTKANWIGHIFRRSCLLKHVTEGTL